MPSTTTPISEQGERIRHVSITGRLPHWKRRAWTSVDRLAVALVVGQSVFLAIVAFPGSFYRDDLPRMSQAARSPLSWDYLTTGVFGQLAPGYRLIFWLQVHVAPLHHGATVIASLAAQAAVSALFWLLLRRIFGPRPAVLVPMIAFTLSAGQLPSFLWWSAAVNLLPAQLALLVAMLAHLEVLRGRRRAQTVVIVSLVFGLLFWAKVALLIIELPLLTFAITNGTWLDRWRRVRGLWRVWLAYTYPVAIFLLLFTIGGYGSPRQDTSPLDLARFVGVTMSQCLAPALVGGPVSWSRIGPYFGVAAPTLALTVGSCLALAAYAVVCLRRNLRAATVGLALLVVPVTVSAVVTGMTRFSYFGFNVARDYRYLSDLIIPALLGLALAGLRPVSRVSAGATARGLLPPTPAKEPSRRVVRIGAAVVTLALFTAMVSVSAYRYATFWHENPVGRYLANAHESLAVEPGGVPLGIYDLTVPSYVLDPVFAPDNQISRVLAPMRSQPIYDASGQLMGVLDDTGRASAVRLETTSVSAAGPAGDCHWFASDGDVTVDLLAVAPLSDYVVTVYYLANATTPVNIDTRYLRKRTATFTSHDPLRMEKGLGTLIVQAPARAIDSIDVRNLSADVCVMRVDVQRALPVTESRP